MELRVGVDGAVSDSRVRELDVEFLVRSEEALEQESLAAGDFGEFNVGAVSVAAMAFESRPCAFNHDATTLGWLVSSGPNFVVSSEDLAGGATMELRAGVDLGTDP